MDLLSHFDSLEFHNEEPSSPPEEFHRVIEDILLGPASAAPTNSPGLQFSKPARDCNLILHWKYAQGHGACCRNGNYRLLSRCCDLLLLYHNADLWCIGQSIFNLVPCLR